MNASFGKMLIFAGLALVLVGLIFTFSAKIPWLGRLPGDIYVQKKGFSLYFPLTTSIIISIIISVILVLLRKR